MAGLLNKQQGAATPAPGGMQAPGGMPTAGGMPQQGMPGPEGAPGEESNVTPEEQAEYDQFVTNGMTLIHDEKTLPQLIESIRSVEDPVTGLGNALATVVMGLEDSAREQGKELDGDVMFHGAAELLEQMVELAEAAQIHEYSEEEIEGALYLALDTYRVTRQEQGTLPVEALQEDMQMLVQADQAGQLDQVLPGISDYAKRAPKPEGA